MVKIKALKEKECIKTLYFITLYHEILTFDQLHLCINKVLRLSEERRIINRRRSLSQSKGVPEPVEGVTRQNLQFLQKEHA